MFYNYLELSETQKQMIDDFRAKMRANDERRQQGPPPPKGPPKTAGLNSEDGGASSQRKIENDSQRKGPFWARGQRVKRYYFRQKTRFKWNKNVVL